MLFRVQDGTIGKHLGGSLELIIKICKKKCHRSGGFKYERKITKKKLAATVFGELG